MENTQDEFTSLFIFLGKPAGGEVGKAVYAAAKAKSEKVETEEIVTPRFTGKILKYRKSFLNEYFQTPKPVVNESNDWDSDITNTYDNDDLPF